MKTMSKNALFASASVLAVAMITPSGAIAQSSSEGAADSETADDNIIIVSATRREQSILEVPAAVTVISREALEQSGVTDITSLERVSASYNINTSDTTTGGVTLRLRGIGTTGNNVGLESSVGIFVDGVYTPRPGGGVSDLGDIERVEVLRGPQGTLFGRNTSAGALVIRTERPDFDQSYVWGNLTAGNYSLRSGQLGVNLPVVDDRLALRFGGSFRNRNGLVTGQNNDQSGTIDRYAFRAQALLDMGDAGELRLIGAYTNGNDRCCMAVWLQRSPFIEQFSAPFSAFAPTAGAPNVGRNAQNNYLANDENFTNPYHGWSVIAHYDVDTPIGHIAYVGSYGRSFADSYRGDYTGLDIYTVGDSPEAAALGLGRNLEPLNGTRIRSTSHELRLSNTAFDDNLDWMIGAYYSRETIDQKYTLTFLNDMQRGVSVGAFGQPFFNELNYISGGVDAVGDFAAPNPYQSGNSFSVFTHNIVSLTDSFDLTVGARYVTENKSANLREQVPGQHNACFGTFNNLVNTVPVYAGAEARLSAAVQTNCWIFTAPFYDPNDPTNFFAPFAASANPFIRSLVDTIPQPFDRDFSDDELVYTISGSYEIGPETFIYGGYTHGFKSGGFNLDVSAAAGGRDPRFRSETIDAFELGFKTIFWNGRGWTNIALFHSEMSDFQVLEFDGVRFQTFNALRALSSGVEFEGGLQISENFGTNLAVTYTDARYPSDCAIFDPTDPGFVPSLTALCGSRLTNAPELVIIGGANVELPLVRDRLNFFASTSVRYESDRRTSTLPTELPATAGALTEADVRAAVAAAPPLPGDIQGSNAKVDLRIGLRTANENFSIELWGLNVLDRRTSFLTFNIPLRGFSGNRARGRFMQDPATYGVTVRARF